ncbi:acyl-CoA synthetase [Advenella mimigardefordensis]|uniref:AMP-dependent ligase n=1 Tax=Advenella mimigardefordensis (strain DSM 17166 / LMG 22922 / DPN7) TaxID=1247726 RepID=W0PFX6_ADVMD|nr:acyl-CoA synthetase [Advenella mimigardefordensis]AHG65914.1 AMP-dependent ligase [Advenella mimigardefordensis DPN7]
MLTRHATYAATVAATLWDVPQHYNIGVDVCDKWADGTGRLAIIHEKSPNHIQYYTFDQLKAYSNRFAHVLQQAGVVRGDRVGILLAQGIETAIAHIACYKLGLIAIPLFSLFGSDALAYRLSNSGARALVTNAEGVAKLASIETPLPQLQTVVDIDATQDTPAAPITLAFWPALQQQPDTFEPVPTLADDPAVIIYTSGTTGKPKGALHAHRVLLGHLPGVEMSHNFFPDHAKVMWTPADWAWIGGLFDVLMPSLHHGIPVLACRFAKFTAEAAFDIMSRHQVTHTFLPPTALKMLRRLENPRDRWPLALHSIASGGESLGLELIDWGRRNLDITINEFYGQTECNMLVSSCADLFEPKIGSMGKAVPGHDIQIVNDQGDILPDGAEGNIGVRRPDPVMFLSYWNNPEATQEKFAGDFLVTGDVGVRDEEGFFRFVGRNDDVITSAGYRIGPGPIEDCILGHPQVSMVAVVGLPDDERTEAVTAFVVLNEGVEPSDALKKDIQEHVKTRVAAHEYPRRVYFVDALPMTTTGKIIRKELRNYTETAG